MKSSRKVLAIACLGLVSGLTHAGALSVTPATTQAPVAGGATLITPHSIVYTQAGSGRRPTISKVGLRITPPF